KRAPSVGVVHRLALYPEFERPRAVGRRAGEPHLGIAYCIQIDDLAPCAGLHPGDEGELAANVRARLYVRVQLAYRRLWPRKRARRKPNLLFHVRGSALPKRPVAVEDLGKIGGI